MLRVCGVTYNHTTNYGSCMQAYALQTAIEKMTVCNDACHYELVPLLKCGDYPAKARKNKKLHIRLLYKAGLHLSRIPFRRFHNSMMKHAKCKRMADLEKLNDEFDAFVCGSDVIWRPKFNYNHPAYYLTFAHKYKFSYAASFGTSDIQDIVAEHQEQLMQFDQISLRESSSQPLVEQYTGKKAEVVADPVLLLQKNDWDQVAKGKPKGGYIFVYLTAGETKAIKRIINQLQNETHLPVKKTVWNERVLRQIKKRLKEGRILEDTPQKWLHRIKDAEYVVTNSFHATVFSTIFQKKFFTVAYGTGIDKAENIRPYDYLRRLGLLDRMLLDAPASFDLSPIDYTYANEQIKEIREHSLNYLKQNLEAAYLRKTRQDGQGKE